MHQETKENLQKHGEMGLSVDVATKYRILKLYKNILWHSVHFFSVLLPLHLALTAFDSHSVWTHIAQNIWISSHSVFHSFHKIFHVCNMCNAVFIVPLPCSLLCVVYALGKRTVLWNVRGYIESLALGNVINIFV